MSIDYDQLVSIGMVPACPFCGKWVNEDEMPVVFLAHGYKVLAHDDCRQKLIPRKNGMRP